MLSVYTRHHPDCKNASDKDWRRCSCPKWIWGAVNGTFIRRSARTHLWEEAEERRLRLLQGLALATLPASQPNTESPVSTPNLIFPPTVSARNPDSESLPPAPKRPRVRIEDAVDAYLDDAASRNVAESTLEKLKIISFASSSSLESWDKDSNTSTRSIMMPC